MKFILFSLVILFGFSSYGQTLLIDPNNDGGFELGNSFAANGWTIVNSSNNNGNNWYLTNSPLNIGFYSFAPTGNRTAYISQSPNGPWTYNIYQYTASHFYKEISFPAGQKDIQLKFKWNAFGEGPIYDVLYVYTCPNSLTPIAGQPFGTSNATTGWNGIGTSILHATLHSSNDLNGNTEIIYLPEYFAGTTLRLVFTWKNGATVGNMPPATIDSIWLFSDCFKPDVNNTNISSPPCSSEVSIDATVIASDGNGTFQWTVDGIVIPSMNTSHFYSNSITNNATISCIYYDNNICNYKDTSTVQVSINTNSYKTDTLELCSGDLPFLWRGVTIPKGAVSDSNFASITISTTNGCDSVFILNLQIQLSPPIKTDTISVCRGQLSTISWRGKSIPNNAQSNVRYDSIKVASPNGCDSLLYLNLNIIETAVFSDSTINSCNPIEFNGQLYTHSETIYDTLKNIENCDSIIYRTFLNINLFEFNLIMVPNRKYLTGEVITIKAVSNNSNFEILSWSPSTLFPNVMSATQNISGPDHLLVSAIAKKNGSSCIDTAFLQLDALVLNKNVEMPSAFSPNGDGKNDIFQPVLNQESIKAIKRFVIYNRWGQSVFDVFSGNSNIGWDGFYKGKPADVGLYFYEILVEFSDKTTFRKSGEIYLLR
ncbi:MAG TPA: gliding motility-associated C-terminal domain-containing protein [Edaphocola sp.]|nr:gliding motility-associated C-terminal domain-containing protein [Edaphocola sp.]